MIKVLHLKPAKKSGKKNKQKFKNLGMFSSSSLHQNHRIVSRLSLSSSSSILRLLVSSFLLLVNIIIIIVVAFSSCTNTNNNIFVTAQVSPTTGSGTLFPSDAQTPYPSSRSRWFCPRSCGTSADRFCSDTFGMGGNLVAQNCVTAPDVGVISFECVCNSGGVNGNTLKPIKVVHFSQLTSTTTTVPPVTSEAPITTTTLPPQPKRTRTRTHSPTYNESSPSLSESRTVEESVSNVSQSHSETVSLKNESDDGNSSSNSNESSSSASPEDNSTTTSPTSTTKATSATTLSQSSTTSSSSSTTTTSPLPSTSPTPTTTEDPGDGSENCQVAPETAAFFQASPFGMFCRATTGTCPTSCVASNNDQSATTIAPSSPSSNEQKSSSSLENPSLLPFAEDCTYGILSCTRLNSTAIVSTCQSCNAGSFRMMTILSSSSSSGGSSSSSIDKCSYSVERYSPSSSSIEEAIDVTPPGSCSGQNRCSGNGCCRSFSSCSCYTSNVWGFYAGTSCSVCDSRYLRDSESGLCTLEIPPVLRLLDLLGSRPSAIVAPVLVVAAVSVGIAFLARSRWASDQERYIVPPGVALVDPNTGFSVSPNSRFYIPPRPRASRGIVNQRAIEKEAEMVEKMRKTMKVFKEMAKGAVVGGNHHQHQSQQQQQQQTTQNQSHK